MPKIKTKLTLRRTDEWKKNLVRGDVIAVAVPNDVDQRGNQKYRPAIVLENKFNSELPVQTVNVQTLSALSNWSAENRENSIEESFFWNNRQQYIQQVGFTEISYGLIKNYYGFNKQTFTDSAVAMQLIKKKYKIDNNWSNLEPAGVLLTAYETQQMAAFKTKLEAEFEQLEQQKDYEMNQLTSENLKKEEKYKLEKKKNSKLQDEIDKLRQENQQSQQMIVQQKKAIVKQKEQLTELSQKDQQSQQIIVQQEKAIVKQKEQLTELSQKDQQSQQMIVQQEKAIVEQEEQLTELLQKDYESQQIIANQQQQFFELNEKYYQLQDFFANQQQQIANQQQQLTELLQQNYQSQQMITNQQRQINELLQKVCKSNELIDHQKIEIIELRKNIADSLNAPSKNFDLDEVNAYQYDEKLQSDFVSNPSPSANY